MYYGSSLVFPCVGIGVLVGENFKLILYGIIAQFLIGDCQCFILGDL